ncbi:MAG: hypothetical protein AAGD25_03885 [Cyanobacteria bacterium P01_F01_bin.150]
MSSHHRSLLNIAEYASASASGIGSIIAIATQQIAYSVIPLSVTVALNLASRRQQEQQISKHIDQHLAQANTSVQQLERRVDGFSKHTQKLQQELNALAQRFEQQQEQRQEQPDPQTNHNLAQLQALEQTLRQELSQQVQAFTDVVGELRDRLNQHDQQMATFARVSSVDTWTTQLEQLLPSVDAIANKIDQLDQIDQKIDDRFQQLTQTQQQTFASQQSQLQQFTQTQQQAFATQQQAFADQRTEVDQQTRRLDTDVTQLSELLTQLQQEINSLRIEFRSIPAPSEPPSESSAREIPPDPDQLPSSESLIRDQWHNIVPQLPTAGKDYDIDLNIGIDFGTGFTKVCFRDLSRDQAEIVTFVDINTLEHPLPLEQTLIPTKLAILEDGTLLTGLTLAEWEEGDYCIEQTIDFIKMRLADLDLPSESSSESLWRLEKLPELDDPIIVERLSAYYLSQVIQRAQKWIKSHHADLLTNQTVRWSINVGVPVEYCDSPALARFQKVLSLAWVLSQTDLNTPNVTLSSLTQLLDHLEKWMVDNAVQELDCATTPEIAAAVWSFLDSREAQEGFYTFFDIGDGTLDGAAFRFWRQDGGKYVDFYKGEVQPLGVTAFAQQAAKELGSTSHQIRMMLASNGNRASEQQLSSLNPDPELYDQTLHDKLQDSTTRLNVQRLVASVVMDGNEKHQDARGGMYKNDLDATLNVFVGGGGGNTPFFRTTIQSTHAEFNQGSASIPPYEIKDIPPPKNLAINGIDPVNFNRFAVAYGLCIPNWEGPAIRLPSQVESDDSSSYEAFDGPMHYGDTKDMT